MVFYLSVTHMERYHTILLLPKKQETNFVVLWPSILIDMIIRQLRCGHSYISYPSILHLCINCVHIPCIFFKNLSLFFAAHICWSHIPLFSIIKIPSPLTEELEQEQQRKAAEKKKQQQKGKKERQKVTTKKTSLLVLISKYNFVN